MVAQQLHCSNFLPLREKSQIQDKNVFEHLALDGSEMTTSKIPSSFPSWAFFDAQGN